MALRKTLRDLVVDNVARFRQGVRARFGNDTGDEVSIRFDGTALVIQDETNGVEQVRIPLNDDLADLVQQGGEHEINVGGLSGSLGDRQNPVTHETRHRAGGADEINVEYLSHRSVIEQGRVLTTDGDGTLSWGATESRPTEFDITVQRKLAER
jgi:hypothetical protein